jgi:hypothetical protein
MVECFAYREAVARVERQRNPGAALPHGQGIPGFPEFIIGPAGGRTRWLNPGYGAATG